MTTFKRIWWEDGVQYEQDISPDDIYLSVEEIVHARLQERKDEH